MVLFLLMVVSTIGAIGQKDHKLYPMIQPLKEGGYTVSEFKNFLLSPTPLAVDYCDKMLSRVNRFLNETGLSAKYNNGLPLDRRNIKFLFQMIETRNRIHEGFINSHRDDSGKKVIPYLDNRRFEGLVFTLCIEGYELDLAKAECENFIDVPYLFLTPLPEEKKAKEEKVANNALPEDDGGSILIKKKTVAVDIKAPILENPNHPHTLLWVGAGILATSLIYYGIHELGEKHGGSPVTAPGHTDPNTGGPVTAPGHGDAVNSPYYLPVYRPITYTNTLVIRNNASMERYKWVSIHLGF